MTPEEKIKYLRAGLNLVGIQSNNDVLADTIIRVYEGISEKKDQFSIADANVIVEEINKKYNAQNPPLNVQSKKNDPA
jgi:hypothetical protein